MNKEKQFNRMIDIISYNIGNIKEIIEEYNKEELIDNIDSYEIIELTTIIYTTSELTDITSAEIDKYLLTEINMTYEDLRQLEDELID